MSDNKEKDLMKDQPQKASSISKQDRILAYQLKKTNEVDSSINRLESFFSKYLTETSGYTTSFNFEYIFSQFMIDSGKAAIDDLPKFKSCKEWLDEAHGDPLSLEQDPKGNYFERVNCIKDLSECSYNFENIGRIPYNFLDLKIERENFISSI